VSKANTPLKNNLLNRFYAICKKAGIEDGKQGGSVDIHSLRVTFTTLAIDHGASPKAVQELLGHSTLDLTMKVYAKATEKAKRDAISALPFATLSAPEHVIPVQNAHSLRTSSESKTESQMQQRLRIAT
jgi:integrase